MPVGGPQPVFTDGYNRVTIGKLINGAMQGNAAGNLRLKLLQQVSSFHKIANEVAHHNFGVVA